METQYILDNKSSFPRTLELEFQLMKPEVKVQGLYTRV